MGSKPEHFCEAIIKLGAETVDGVPLFPSVLLSPVEFQYPGREFSDVLQSLASKKTSKFSIQFKKL